MNDPRIEYILCAAIRRNERRDCVNPYHEGLNDILDIEIGYRHHDVFRRFFNEVSRKPQDQGFYTSFGKFVDRKRAMEIAWNANQVTDDCAFNDDGEFRELYSEDLYMGELFNKKKDEER